MYRIIQFSPTGNTKYLAKHLSKHLGDIPVESLEFSRPQSLLEDHLILLYAIHAFNAPRTVRRFIRKLPSGTHQKISLIGIGCNNMWVNDGASKTIRKILVKKGYQVMVDEIIAMPLTMVMAFPEDLIKNQLVVAKDKIEAISRQIKGSSVTHRPIRMKSHVLSYLGKLEDGAARLFGLELHADMKCNQCGQCVKYCPEKNISMTDKGKLRFGLRCMMCMRCIYSCEKKAISPRMSKFIPLKDGYDLKRHLS